MNGFYPSVHTAENQHGNKIDYCFVSKRLCGLIQKKKFSWIYRYFDLKHFTMFDGEYIAILISSNGLILFVKNNDIEQHIERDSCTELMSIFVEKNTNLSLKDLIKFSEKYGLNIDIKFK